jgi:tetratricopeptide (TPR) repeat protein
MLRTLLQRWRSLSSQSKDVAVLPATVTARVTAYRSTPWFDAAWRLPADGRHEEVAEYPAADGRDQAEQNCLCAVAAFERGDLDEALVYVDSALAARPNFSQAHLQRARILYSSGQHPAALAAFQRATELTPGDAQAWTGQAQAHVALDEREDARDCYELALAHAPDCVAARLGLSRLLRDAGDIEAALAHVMHALKIAPHDAQIHFEAALIQRRAGDARGSIEAYERALELKPDFIAARINLGLMYLSVSGDPSRAQMQFKRAIEIDPACVAAQANLGLALEEQGQIVEAIAHYENLIAANPAENEFRWNRGLALLGSGDFARGWEDYELRHARGAGAAPRVFPYPEWRGGALRSGDVLLVYAEQGLGDEIMFASCIPELLAHGVSVVLECDPRLEALFARSFPGACVRGAPRDRDRSWLAEFPQIKEQIAIGSLPRLLRRDVADFPSRRGYLHADPARVAHWRARLARCGAGKKIGITWRGGTAGTRRELRSIPVRELAPLFEIPGVVFVNLQRDAGDLITDIPPGSGSPVVNFAAALNDVDETAALLQALDGVIAADNSVAHLAGALGSRTWIILSHSNDWRWLRGISNSPWYSSVTLCRQPAPGDWAGTIEKLGAELKSQLQVK